MEKKKVNVTILSLLMIGLASSAIVGGTYALWSKNVKFENHLSSGNLQLKLERTKLTKVGLNTTTGLLVETTDNTTKDFTSSSSNIFDIGSGEMVVPGCYYETTLKLTNSGSVAFDYSVIFNVSDTTPNELAKQMKLSFNGTDKGYLADDKNKTFTIGTGSVNKGQSSEEFTIKVDFADLTTNNDAMGQTVNFDLTVNATQKTK